MKSLAALDPADLAEIQVRLGSCWGDLAGARLLLTGCTGFFGPWLLEPLLAADAALGLGLRIWVLTRDPEGFRGRLPHLAGHPAVALLAGDVRAFEPPGIRFTHLVHGAASSNTRRDPQSPEAMQETILAGTRRALAAAAGARRALFISSGAVYGPQPPDLECVPETWPTPPLETGYGEGKRTAEHMCMQSQIPVAIARCFAFLAPHLPLDAHFAAGDFLGDVLAGRPISVVGDGRPVRSYLYGTDLACWLITILLRGEPGRPYNVGSEFAVSIRELAEAVAGGAPVDIAQPPGPGPAPRYLPCTLRARQELGLAQNVDLAEAIRRTLAWHRLAATPERP